MSGGIRAGSGPLREVHEYMRRPDGSRNRSFEVEGVKVLVEGHEDDDHAKSVAEFLASAHEVTEHLRTEVQRLRAEVPPKSPVRMLGTGCVRMRDGQIYLLNRQEGGWSEFALQMESWDDLFRRFNVVVGKRGTDAFGDYWPVSNCEVAS